MSRLVRLVLAGLLASLLAVLLVGAPAQAGPRSPDPELVPQAARTSPPSAAKVIPSAIDSDVYAYAVAPKSIYFVVAGHLRLALTSGSTTKYQGSFVDYVGNRSTRASVDASDATAPVLKLEARNGKFTFRLDSSFGIGSYSGTATSKPSKLKVPVAQIVLGASTHTTRTASYAITLTERSGAVSNPIEYAGSLTIAYDTNGRISGGQITVTNAKGKNVTHALKGSGYYGGGYFYTLAQVDKKYFGLTATVTGPSFNGFGFGADGAKTTQWIVSGTA